MGIHGITARVKVRILACGGFLALASYAEGGATRFADSQLLTGANDGSSWAAAFRGPLALQAALASALPGDEIWVADGLYLPASAGSGPSASFHLKDNVKVLGGFAGGEANSAERDPAENPTVLSGDLDGAANSFPLDQSHHVVTATNLSAGALLDGFTITSGIGGDFGNDSFGGGVAVFGGAPTIRNCTFVDNEASAGGGLALIESTSLVENCTFGPNYAQMGAGLVNFAGSPIVRKCVFSGEYPSTGGNSGLGIYSGTMGGLENPDMTIEGCRFSIIAREFSCPAGVAVATGAGHLVVRDCQFIGNIGCGSGAMQVDGVVEIERSVFIGNEGKFDGGAAIHSFDGDVSITNSLFSGNDRLGFSTIYTGGKLRIRNCTLANNGSATPAPGSGAHFLIVNQNADIAVSNSIVWGNKSSQNNSSAVISSFGTSTVVPRFDSCIVQSWGAFVSTVAGQNSLAADPLFVSVPGLDGIAGSEDDNLRLQTASPAIDRGDNNLLGPAFALDLDGLLRRRDDPATTDFMPGSAPEIDIGAYEFGPACRSDINADGFVDDADFVLFAAAYDLLDCADPVMPVGCASDLNNDANVDDADFVLFANAYDALVCP